MWSNCSRVCRLKTDAGGRVRQEEADAEPDVRRKLREYSFYSDVVPLLYGLCTVYLWKTLQIRLHKPSRNPWHLRWHFFSNVYRGLTEKFHLRLLTSWLGHTKDSTKPWQISESRAWLDILTLTWPLSTAVTAQLTSPTAPNEAQVIEPGYLALDGRRGVAKLGRVVLVISCHHRHQGAVRDVAKGDHLVKQGCETESYETIKAQITKIKQE